MAKIFRLYTGGNTASLGWFDCPTFPYDSQNLQTIIDPAGASAKKEITSIPSPFARIDLVKTAFKEVCILSTSNDPQTVQKGLSGNTIFHKMVSDTLDVAEIFFNIGKYPDKIQILKWDPQKGIAALKNSVSPGQIYLGDALEKYIQSDGATYNFNKLQSIYLLNYIGNTGPSKINIIGATSPATLFFSTANDLSYVKGIQFGQDIPFDGAFQPLYKRDHAFVEYLFALKQGPQFAVLFPEVNNYLIATRRAVAGTNFATELDNVDVNYFANLSPITITTGQQSNIVEVVGMTLYKKVGANSITSSDFMLNSAIATGTMPLVLPVHSGNKYCNLQYTTDIWGTENSAPFLEKEPNLSKRILPADGSAYPYLTISDFLEDNLIRVPYTLNKTSYFDGNLISDKTNVSYLLPVKLKFFEYFTAEELRGKMADGKPMIEISAKIPGCVTVTLRIKIKGQDNVSYVEYSRVYSEDCSADAINNKGAIKDFDFTGFIMPPVKFNNPKEAIYNVTCIQNSEGDLEFCFYNSTQRISSDHSCRDEDKTTSNRADNYLIKGTCFDAIKVSNSLYGGILLPKFKVQRNIETFEFAVDLGTSNTHIEYKTGNTNDNPFDFSEQDCSLCQIFIPSKNEEGYLEELQEETDLIEKDYIPMKIGDGDYRFPTRTVLSYAKATDWQNNVDPFTLANLPLTYDKKDGWKYNVYRTNIKWETGTNQIKTMTAYVRCLMLIMRNKVLMNDGALNQTKITWFYPTSMATKRRTALETAWNNAYREYFSTTGTTSCMTESSAPIQYFFNRYPAIHDLVNIDIGGGTTDISFAQRNAVIYVTSFRFATDTLFEDVFTPLNTNNGIIDFYKNHFKELFQRQDIRAYKNIYNQKVAAQDRPANWASFLFGLKTSSAFKKLNEVDYDFNAMLGNDEDFKIEFIIFYTAIIYHIAHIIKLKSLDVPDHIFFSGNGSKIIGIISRNTEVLADYTKLVFEKVLGLNSYGKKLEFYGLEPGAKSKESTCKGGLIGAPGGNGNDRDKIVILKSDCSGFVGDDDTYETISDEYFKRVIVEVEKFFDFVLVEMNKAFNFDDKFGVTKQSIDIARETAKHDLKTFLENGIAVNRKEAESQNDKIEETFFFHPIKGVLQAISMEILKSKQ